MSLNSIDILVRKKQTAKKDVVLDRIFDAPLAVKKSPNPALDCPIPRPPPSDFWSKTKTTRKAHTIKCIDRTTANIG